MNVVSGYVNSSQNVSQVAKEDIIPNSLVNVTRISSTIWDGFFGLTEYATSRSKLESSEVIYENGTLSEEATEDANLPDIKESPTKAGKLQKKSKKIKLWIN